MAYMDDQDFFIRGAVKRFYEFLKDCTSPLYYLHSFELCAESDEYISLSFVLFDEDGSKLSAVYGYNLVDPVFLQTCRGGLDKSLRSPEFSAGITGPMCIFLGELGEQLEGASVSSVTYFSHSGSRESVSWSLDPSSDPSSGVESYRVVVGEDTL